MDTPPSASRVAPELLSTLDDSLSSLATRRRLLHRGVGFAPVLVEAVPRSSIDGDFGIVGSTALSWQPCAGYTPESWMDPGLAYDWPAEYARSGQQATRFDEVFGEHQGYPSMTLLEVLQLRTASGKDDVARHAVAAALNSAKGLTAPEFFGLDILRSMWLSYVTLGHCVPVPGVQWYADSSTPPGAGSIVQWLRSTMRR
jgi:hypothetical protein